MRRNTASVQAAARAQQLTQLTGAELLGLSEVELMRTFDLSRSEAQVTVLTVTGVGSCRLYSRLSATPSAVPVSTHQHY